MPRTFLKLTLRQIVEEASACIPGCGRIPLQTDHLKMNKFSDPNNRSFLSISGEIRRMCLNAKDGIHEKDHKCLADLWTTDPWLDKKRTEETKGGLLKDSYRWILDNADFRQWRDDETARLLWINGDPGKGKTMLLCGIINKLSQTKPRDSNTSLSFFFC